MPSDPSNCASLPDQAVREIPDMVSLYECKDCDAWGTEPCCDDSHHRRSFERVTFVSWRQHDAVLREGQQALVRATRLRGALEHVIESCEHSSPTIHAYDYIAHSAREALNGDTDD